MSQSTPIALEVRIRHVEPRAEVADLIRHRLREVLGRFSGEIASATARVEDVNGPRGGRDTRVAVEVRGPRIGALAVERVVVDVRAGVVDVSERLLRVIRRRLSRQMRLATPR